ncbi:hypothetical protein Gorai_007478, partial [Gossypium raimondii]|nr:hypothetical protein [Gossypium raimondii]
MLWKQQTQTAEYVDQHANGYLHGWLATRVVHEAQGFPQQSTMGTNAIVRSDSGHFVCCIIGFKSGILDPFMTEVITACEAFLSLHSWHVKNAIMEIDNRRLWDACVA